MKFTKQIIDNWKKEREERKERKARLEAMFRDFVIDTRPLVPKAPKYPKAALFRHVWKRAIELAKSESNHKLTSLALVNLAIEELRIKSRDSEKYRNQAMDTIQRSHFAELRPFIARLKK